MSLLVGVFLIFDKENAVQRDSCARAEEEVDTLW